MLYELLTKQEEKYPDKIALQIKRDGEYVKYTYKDMMQHARILATRLKNMGIEPGSHVALWGENIPEWCIAYIGIHACGAIVIPLDAQLSNAVVVNLLKFADAKALICSENLIKRANEIREEAYVQVLTLEPKEIEHSIFSTTEEKAAIEYFRAEEDDIASLIFTSGTTGDPKGVMLSCNNLVSNARGCIERVGLSEEDVFICVLPLHHSYAFTSTFISGLLCGGSITFQPILQGPAIISAIQETGVSIMAAVPQLLTLFDKAIFDKIAAQPVFKKVIFKLLYSIARTARRMFGWNLGKIFFKQIHQRFGNRFRYFVSGGAKLDFEVANHFWDLGICLLEGYGLTETSPVIAITPSDKFYPGSVGKAVPGVQVKIANPNEEEIGEIIMCGPSLMKGYYKNEKVTAEVIKDGWFYTGDLGYIKDELIYITGRAKEIIVLSSGKNIYPNEVEKVFEDSCSLVKEICVMGEKKPDGKVDRLLGLVVPDFDAVKRAKVNSINTEIKFAVENINIKLPSYMRLTSVKITPDSFPRTRLGKLRRKTIEDMQLEEYQESEKSTELSEEDKKLLERSSTKILLQKLQNLSDFKEEIQPFHSLELDLGIDSLKYMELLVILEESFSLKYTPQEAPSFTHVRDILKILPEAERVPEGTETPGGFNWGTLLRKRRTPSLREILDLDFGFLFCIWVGFIRFAIGRVLFRLLSGGKSLGYSKLLEVQGPMILAPNHRSYWDPILIYCHLPKKIFHKTVFIAFAAIYETWPFSKIVKLSRVIKTAGAHSTLSSLQYSAEALDNGYNVCIFPEGQRTPDGKIIDPMIGTGVLACECQVPVYPILVEGGMESLSRQNPGVHLCNMKFSLLDPIQPPKKEKYTEEDYKWVVERWKEEIVKHAPKDYH